MLFHFIMIENIERQKHMSTSLVSEASAYGRAGWQYINGSLFLVTK